MTTVPIAVTPHHIAQGVRKHNFHNPIALAVQVFDQYAVVTLDHIHVLAGVLPIPERVRYAIMQYNKTGNIDPFSFELALP